MAAVTNSLKEAQAMYSGYDPLTVGIGLSNPTTGFYASQSYRRMKTQILLLNAVTDITYAGWEEDREPQILSIKLEPQYNTVLAYNLHYIPFHYRQAILKLVLAMNAPRIKQNMPLYVDYKYLKQHIPQSKHIVRRYKVTGIRVIGNIPLIEWPKAIREQSKWQNVYQLKNHGKFA